MLTVIQECSTIHYHTSCFPSHCFSVRDANVDFVGKFIDDRLSNWNMADLTLTDHNIALNNGAFILRNSVSSFPRSDSFSEAYSALRSGGKNSSNGGKTSVPPSSTSPSLVITNLRPTPSSHVSCWVMFNANSQSDNSPSSNS